MKKRSILAVMSFATGAVIAAVSPPPAAQADALDGALNPGDALSQLDTLPTDLTGETTAITGDAPIS
ncbi:hypothetical protein [Streptomyces zhihengii]|uniref:Secreted protein n=1 Tax=Streptomyces zhihengii TaxID=1818004 RepID=A0ABS2UIT2_9ACTN|nr:hypothetical protein [Streptomyces zhihengii]MBM9617484.1 hypothetical protein [Streptomyces zhihengii]